MSKEEIWKPVKGYEEFYEVSNTGVIRTIERFIVLSTHRYFKKQIILKQHKDGRGYYHVKLYDGNAKPKSLTVHRIVLTTFAQNTDNLPEINHIDGDKSNNNDWNLEWCTHAQNMKHVKTMNQKRPSVQGENNVTSKLTEKEVIEIRKKYDNEGVKMSKLALNYGVRVGNIDFIVKRKTWKHV